MVWSAQSPVQTRLNGGSESGCAVPVGNYEKVLEEAGVLGGYLVQQMTLVGVDKDALLVDEGYLRTG